MAQSRTLDPRLMDRLVSPTTYLIVPPKLYPPRPLPFQLLRLQTSRSALTPLSHILHLPSGSPGKPIFHIHLESDPLSHPLPSATLVWSPSLGSLSRCPHRGHSPPHIQSDPFKTCQPGRFLAQPSGSSPNTSLRVCPVLPVLQVAQSQLLTQTSLS